MANTDRGMRARVKHRSAAGWTSVGAIVLGLLLPPPAFGQGSPGPTSVQAQATAHYLAGVDAGKTGQWEKAREAFLKAWTLQPHYQIAANLGRAELMTRRYRDAAEHLRYFVREAPADVNADERKKAEEMLADAQAKIGTVAIEVDVPGAEVTVDGTPLGSSPLREPVFVEPGKRTFQAKRQGYNPATMPMEVATGSTSTVTLHLVKVEAPTRPPSAGAPGAQTMQPPVVPEPKDTGGAPRWKPFAIGGGAVLAAAGLGVGIGFTVVSNARGKEALDVHDKLVIATSSALPICHEGSPARNKANCDELLDLQDKRDSAQAVAIVGYALGGAAAVGTVLFAILPRKSPDRSTGMQVTPVLSPGQSGVLITGSF